MINNLELIKPLLNFENEGDFYMLYIFKRKKDQPENERENHQSVRTIKTYCVESIEYLEKRWDEITHLCEYFKARAYIHVQKQNHKDVGLNMMIELAQKIKDGVYKFDNLFDSVVGQLKTKEKRWIVDVDTKENSNLKLIIYSINNARPLNGVKIEAVIPTKQGYHLITKPFDTISIKDLVGSLAGFGHQAIIPDIQKKNPTLLYLPNSLS